MSNEEWVERELDFLRYCAIEARTKAPQMIEEVSEYLGSIALGGDYE